MTDKLKDLMQQDLLAGPFTNYAVIVEGRVIPGLSGFSENGKTELIVDGRFSATFDNETARQVAWLLANAIAVAKGFSHVGAKEKDRPFAPMLMDLGAIGDADDLLGENHDRQT